MTTTTRFPPRAPVLPPEVSAKVQSELQPGERLVWADQPNPKVFSRGGWIITLFGIPFTAFALFWMGMSGGLIWAHGHIAGGSGVSWLANLIPLFGLPFLAIGVGMLLAPVWFRKSARRTVYAITDRRAIVWRARGLRGEVEVRSFEGPALNETSRVERPDGTGDLIFKEFYSVGYDTDGSRRTTRTRIGFMGIDRVREIEDLLRKTLPSR